MAQKIELKGTDIWKTLEKLRTRVLLDYSLATKCILDSFLPLDRIQLNMKILGEHFNQSHDVEIKIEPIKHDSIERSAQMFIYLNSCPKSIYSWITIFKDLFNNRSPLEIIITLNRILKLSSQEQEDLINITNKIFRKTSLTLSLEFDEINSLTGTTPFLDTKEESDVVHLRSNIDQISSLSNHPVHIIDKNGDLSSSAFIPFCEFGRNMSAMGDKISAFDVPVCNSFKSRIFNDQLCYEIDLEKYKDNKDMDSQLKSGFAFIMDYNEDRQVTINNKISFQEKSGLVDNLVESFESHARIFLNTIGL